MYMIVYAYTTTMQGTRQFVPTSHLSSEPFEERRAAADMYGQPANSHIEFKHTQNDKAVSLSSCVMGLRGPSVREPSASQSLQAYML